MPFLTGATSRLLNQSQLIAYWEKYTPPTKRLRIVELVNIMMNVSAILAAAYVSSLPVM
jgi:hypothetical protein